MHLFSTKAIVIKSTPFKEKDHILQALSQDRGMQSFYVRRKMVNLPSLVEIECSSKSQVHRVANLEVLKSYDHLRDSFLTIKSCGKILNYFQKIQLPGIHSPNLFPFLDRIFDWMDQKHALLCLSLFFTKLLKFEGSFLIKKHCTICRQPLQIFFMDGKNWLCKKHANSALAFSLDEIHTLQKLESEKTKNKLLTINVDEKLCEKLESLFCKHFELEQGEKNGIFPRGRNSSFV